MTDIFPKIFATTKSIAYFVDDLGGFKDASKRFKMFDGPESPTATTPFISVDITAGGQDQRTAWHAPYVTFNVMGDDTETIALWIIANELWDYYRTHNAFSDGTQYQTIGEAIFSQGWNPVTEKKVVSVAIRFGLVE